MTFQSPFRNPMTAIPIGMALLILAVLWPMFFHPASKSGDDLSDAIRGLLFGLAIGINLFSAVRAYRQRHSASN